MLNNNYIFFWRIRLLTLAVTAMISLQLPGCGIVGYSNFKMEEWSMTQQLPNLEKIEISLYGKNQEVAGYYEDSHFEPYFGLTKVLRERYNIAEIYSEGRNRFLVKVEHSVEGSYRKLSMASEFWAGIHAWSFSTIPFMWTERHFIKYSITAPNKEMKSYTYGYVVQNYSWLPFLFFNPGLTTSLKGTLFNDYQEKRIKIYEMIAARFLTESAPFILFPRLTSLPTRTGGM